MNGICSQCTSVGMVLGGWGYWDGMIELETVSFDFDFRGEQLDGEGRDFPAG